MSMYGYCTKEDKSMFALDEEKVIENTKYIYNILSFHTFIFIGVQVFCWNATVRRWKIQPLGVLWGLGRKCPWRNGSTWKLSEGFVLILFILSFFIIIKFQGLALVDRDSQQQCVYLYRASDLPHDVSERFNALFQHREKWKQDDIIPYIE